MLERAVEEAARLLHADGAMVYLVDDASQMRFAVGAGIRDPEARALLADLSLPVGVGLFGHSVANGEVVVSGDYQQDKRFLHSAVADRIVRKANMRSMAAAPLIADGEVLGALGAYSSRTDDFDEAEIALLRALAEHAATAIANTELTERLRHQADELARRVDAQRTLAEMAAQLTSLRDPSAVLEQTLQAAVRLLKGHGGQIGMVVADDDGVMRWGDGHSLVHGDLVPFTKDDHTAVDEGVSGRAVREGRATWTKDYLPDISFPHETNSDAIARRLGIRAVIAAPLLGEDGPIGAIGVYAEAPGAFGADSAELLGLLADQAAIVLINARLYAEAEISAARMARQVEAQQRLLHINQRLLSTLDPADVLELVADGLKSVVWYDYLGVYRVEHDEGLLRPVLARDRNAEAVLGFPIPRGQGVTWWSVEHRQPALLNDALSDARVIRIPGTPDEEEAIIIVPLISGDEVIGALNIARRGGAEVAFTDADFELVQLFAGQAAIAITNARLYEELRERADAQRSLSEIAAQIAALHDPHTVIQRAVADAARLLRADRAQINLALDGGSHLDRPIAAAPTPPSPDDVMVPVGSGIAGMAAAEKRVRWTGDYLGDDAFPHDEGDARIEAQGLHSMMAAPLLGPDRLLGTITVQATSTNAFDADDAELLKLLADQAAIALTNARLYAEVEESERRYRHLVDNSPDIVWSVDTDGRFTFLSDSLESRTGWKPEQLLGQRFTVLSGATTIEAATQAWKMLRAEPNREQRVRLDLPLPDGRIAQTEVAITGTLIDGKFAGAHGSVRDISERERLEGDLRSQAAELAASGERAHLARELHDSVTQALFSMGLTLRSLELLLDTDPTAARGKLGELRELQKDALAEMRTLIFELRPSSLESDGLVQALRTHATAVQRRTGLVIVVDAEPIDRLTLTAEDALYRIGQEALHNVVKHANASNTTIRIVHDGERVRLSVTDDGVGFDPDSVPRGHLGLIGMRQRVDLVGGELMVESLAGQGTTIAASVPVSVE